MVVICITQKTERCTRGLERGAVDKLLVGIFVFSKEEDKKNLSFNQFVDTSTLLTNSRKCHMYTFIRISIYQSMAFSPFIFLTNWIDIISWPLFFVNDDSSTSEQLRLKHAQRIYSHIFISSYSNSLLPVLQEYSTLVVLSRSHDIS